MSSITQLPTAAAKPVVNPKRPGRRPKVVTSLGQARRNRAATSAPERKAPGKVRTVQPAARIPGKFNYPKDMLMQAYFCRGGDGTWYLPGLHLSMLVDEKFVSPIGALLDQLEQEGHDVGGARAEWLAFRDLAKGIQEQIDELRSFAMFMDKKRPVLAQAFLQSGEGAL